MNDWKNLYVEGFINPFFLNEMGGQRRVEVVATQTNRIKLYDQSLVPEESERFIIGESYYVSLICGHFFYIAKKKFDLFQEKERIEYEKRKTEKEKVERLRKNRERAEADMFNSNLNIPVEWNIGHKLVLSGLLANSNGCGINGKTVNHIRLLDDIKGGRFRRNIGDFLCTTNSIGNGKYNYIDMEPVIAVDGDGNKYRPMVTCRKCIEIAKRFDENRYKF